jgi:hypothetical protein
VKRQGVVLDANFFAFDSGTGCVDMYAVVYAEMYAGDYAEIYADTFVDIYANKMYDSW